MNRYVLNASLSEAPNEEFLRAFYLMSYGQDTVIHDNKLFTALPFSLSNVNTSGLTQVAYDSQSQQTIENFDLPQVVRGAVVIALVPTSSDTGSIKKYYDNYIVMEDFVKDAGKGVGYNLYIGVSNSSKTDSSSPFEILEVKLFGVFKGVTNLIK